MAWREKECKNFSWEQERSTVAQGGGKVLYLYNDIVFIQPHKKGVILVS